MENVREPLPRAVLVLVQDEHEIGRGEVSGSVRGDLSLVDDLMTLQLVAKRLGWELHITEVAAELRELFDLAGLSERLDR